MKASQQSTKVKNQNQSKDIAKRFFNANVRSVEGNERRKIISFSSEEPYERWFGVEILDHNDEAVDLSRLNSIGVVLYNHDTDRVIGKIIRAWIEEDRGCAEIEFDSDDFSNVIFEKVENSTLKGVSVGYTVTNWEEVSNDETSVDGRFEGPCSIARKWMPYEISIVSVPADPTVGVERKFNNESKSNNLDLFLKIIQNNKNFL